MAANGAFTTDNVAASQLYTEFSDSVAAANEGGVPFRTQFAKETTQKTVRVRQRSMTAQTLGMDTTVPDAQHLDYVEFDLPAPKRFGVSTRMTRYAFDLGVSSDEMREEHAEALRAMNRRFTEVILAEALQDGGWWDAAMSVAPPKYKSSTFTTSHDHYLKAAQSGTPTLANFVDLKRTIQEHGYGQIVGFMNGVQASKIEKLAEWATVPTIQPNSTLDTLQKLGVTPSFMVSGMAVAVEDWVPENYLLAVSLDEKSMRWRNPEGAGNSGIYTVDTPPDGQYQFISEYYSYQSVKIVHRGAGAVYYINNASWADPTFDI